MHEVIIGENHKTYFDHMGQVSPGHLGARIIDPPLCLGDEVLVTSPTPASNGSPFKSPNLGGRSSFCAHP